MLSLLFCVKILETLKSFNLEKVRKANYIRNSDKRLYETGRPVILAVTLYQENSCCYLLSRKFLLLSIKKIVAVYLLRRITKP